MLEHKEAIQVISFSEFSSLLYLTHSTDILQICIVKISSNLTKRNKKSSQAQTKAMISASWGDY